MIVIRADNVFFLRRCDRPSERRGAFASLDPVKFRRVHIIPGAAATIVVVTAVPDVRRAGRPPRCRATTRTFVVLAAAGHRPACVSVLVVIVPSGGHESRR